MPKIQSARRFGRVQILSLPLLCFKHCGNGAPQAAGLFRGPLLAGVSQAHAVSAVSAIMMPSMAVVGLFYRPAGPLWRSVSWISVFMLALYLLNSYILFLHGA